MVPTHNVGLWVRECLDSILLDQSTIDRPIDIELIVVDDHSTDDTWDILETIALRDSRVRLVRNHGIGGAQARNMGIALARGRYIAFVDGDDIVPRRAYDAMITSLEESGSDLAIGSFIKFWPTRVWQPSLRWPAFQQQHAGSMLSALPSLIRNRACWNRVFRADFLRSIDLWFPTVPRSNDIVPMTRSLLAARSVDVLPQPVYLYRARPGASSMTSLAGSIEGFESYLRQEATCALLIAESGDARLLAEYRSLVLRADGWVHLREFLNSEATARGDEYERASAHLIDLLKALEIPWHHRVPRAWRLAAKGRWSAARRRLNKRTQIRNAVIRMGSNVVSSDRQIFHRIYGAILSGLGRLPAKGPFVKLSGTVTALLSAARSGDVATQRPASATTTKAPQAQVSIPQNPVKAGNEQSAASVPRSARLRWARPAAGHVLLGVTLNGVTPMIAESVCVVWQDDASNEEIHTTVPLCSQQRQQHQIDVDWYVHSQLLGDRTWTLHLKFADQDGEVSIPVEGACGLTASTVILASKHVGKRNPSAQHETTQ